MVIMDFSKSIELLNKTMPITPIAAQTYSKSYRYFYQNYGPFFMKKGKGSKLMDIDSNKFTDFICSLGAITLGYNHKSTNNAIKKQLKKGILFSTQSDLEFQLAELLTHHIPGCETVRFVKNGSDATSSAIRLARAYTGKDIILMSGYHGMDDWSIGSTSNNNGVPKRVRVLTKTFEYNNLPDLEKLLEENTNKVAGVILEPIQGNGPKENYLSDLKKLVHKHKAILIFDEVVSGFRYALGGASELYNVVPDLAAYGKGIANGMPLSFVSGRREIMKLIEENVFVSTTFGGETLSLSAALATIKYMIKQKTQKHFWELGEQLQSGLKKLVLDFKFESFIDLYGLPPRNGFIFKPFNNQEALVYQTMYQKLMLEKGILTLGVNNLMHSHTSKDINRFLTHTKDVFNIMKSSIEKNEFNDYEQSKLMNPIFQRNK